MRTALRLVLRPALAVTLLMILLCRSRTCLLNTPHFGTIISHPQIFVAVSAQPIVGDWSFRWDMREDLEVVTDELGQRRPEQLSFGIARFERISAGNAAMNLAVINMWALFCGLVVANGLVLILDRNYRNRRRPGPKASLDVQAETEYS